MLPGHLDGGFHIVGHDDELRGPVVVMAAKRDYVCPGHSGRKIARNAGESKEGGLDGPLKKFSF